MLKNTDRLFLSDQKQKTCRVLTTIFVFFLAVVEAANAQPQSLSGHFLISTPKLMQTLENLIVQKKPVVGVFEKPLSFSFPVPIAISNIQYNFDWQSESFYPIQNNAIQFVLNNPKIEILVPKVSIDTVLIKEVNGVILRLNVKSTCENIKLITSTDAINIQAAVMGLAESNQVDLSAEITNINLGTPKLTVGDFKCDNISGFEDLIEDEILQQFARIDFYKPVLQEKVNSLIAAHLKKYAAKAEQAITDQILSVDGLTSLRFSLLQINEKFIDIGFSLNNPETTAAFDTDYNISSDAVLVVDKTEMQEFLKEGLSAKLEKLSYSSKDIPELDKLTKSRFKQFFVWPALMKIPKGQELILRPMLESLNIAVKPNAYVKQLDLSATAGLWVFAQKEAMVYLRTYLNATSNVANAAQVQTSISNLKTTSVWDTGYLKRHGNSKRISTGLVDSTAQKFFNNNWATTNLSVLKLTDTNSAKLKRIFYSSGNKLFFELGLDN